MKRYRNETATCFSLICSSYQNDEAPTSGMSVPSSTQLTYSLQT